MPVDAASGVVAFEIPLAVDANNPASPKLPHVSHDSEIPLVVDVEGSRAWASLRFATETGEVTVAICA